MPATEAPLEALTGLLALLCLVQTAVHTLCARAYRGHRRGRAISRRVVLRSYASCVALIALCAALLSLYVHRLLSAPARAGAKSELVVLLAAAASLFWSGFIGADRRRRAVAARLAAVPCFGNGEHAAGHQLLPPPKSSIIVASPNLVTPAASPVRTFSSVTAATAEPSSAASTPEKRLERVRSSTAGITKRKVWELCCRSASTSIYGRAKRQAWPLNVVRTHRTKDKRFVLIKDETVQDGAGAVLLEPAFTHSSHLDKQLIARVVYEAVHRSAVCVLHSWHNNFDARLFYRFTRLPAVVAMLSSDLRQSLARRPCARPSVDLPPERCLMTELLWATITVEVLDYLQYKRRDLPLLSWLVRLPMWLCSHDAARVTADVDAVFEAWKAGRECGKSAMRPCDSECCCHHASTRTGCGCQCPCVCTCA